MLDQELVDSDGPAVALFDDTIIRWLKTLIEPRSQVILGVVGCPGAGKSSLAQDLVQAACELGWGAVWLPMDGFHLADTELDRLGRAARKGAIDTFDVNGYLATLRRVRARTEVVYAPSFDRAVEQPIAGSIPIPPTARLVVTEGNYLLDNEDPWRGVATLVDEMWFCAVDEETRRGRLIRRHIAFGKSAATARQWVDTGDEVNAAAIEANRFRADRHVQSEADGGWSALDRQD